MFDDLKYLKIVLTHKYWVLKYGIERGLPIGQLLKHDLSKFSRAEWGPYKRRFVSNRGGSMDHDYDEQEWQDAWRHHYWNNPHHWEWWYFNAYAHPMREDFADEMIVDWMAASKTYTGLSEILTWYSKHRDKISLHPLTRQYIEKEIGYTYNG